MKVAQFVQIINRAGHAQLLTRSAWTMHGITPLNTETRPNVFVRLQWGHIDYSQIVSEKAIIVRIAFERHVVWAPNKSGTT